MRYQAAKGVPFTITVALVGLAQLGADAALTLQYEPGVLDLGQVKAKGDGSYEAVATLLADGGSASVYASLGGITGTLELSVATSGDQPERLVPDQPPDDGTPHLLLTAAAPAEPVAE